MRDTPADGQGTDEPSTAGVPKGFEQLAVALRTDPEGSGEPVRAELTAVAAGAGTRPLTELLEDLAATYRLVSAVPADPPFHVVRLLVGAWSGSAVGHLPAATCEDPLTGLATMAHVRSKLIELYRLAERHADGSAPPGRLVVIELDPPVKDTPHLDWVVRMIDLGEFFRSVYPGDEVIGQVSGTRAVGVLPRAEHIQDGLAVLLGRLHDWRRREGVSSRMWVESLPATLEAADALLEALASDRSAVGPV